MSKLILSIYIVTLFFSTICLAKDKTEEPVPLNWQEHFRKQVKTTGDFIRTHSIRVSIHPERSQRGH